MIRINLWVSTVSMYLIIEVKVQTACSYPLNLLLMVREIRDLYIYVYHYFTIDNSKITDAKANFE
jgi:hypothetical protein